MRVNPSYPAALAAAPNPYRRFWYDIQAVLRFAETVRAARANF